MSKILVEANKRDVIGKKVKNLRNEGLLPAVLYGYGIDPMPITVEHKSTSRILAKAESSNLITIALDGKEYPTIVRDKQWDYIKRSLLHVDFQVVSMTEKIAAQVRVNIVGTAGAIGAYGAILVTGLSELEIEALPTDLPESIDVDISVLEKIGDSILVRDLELPEELTILTDEGSMLAVATAPAAEISEEEDASTAFGEEDEDNESAE